MQPAANQALKAARQAGQDLIRRLERFDLHHANARELSKFLADCAIGIEKNIIFELKKSFPEHHFLGRETGLNQQQESAPLWRVSVIDEMSNFRLGIPAYAIMISCEQAGKQEHAILIDPMTAEEFVASRGRGAQVSNRRMRCSNEVDLHNIMVAFTQPKGQDELALAQVERIERLLKSRLDVRNIGSNALSMAYVAANRFQAAILSQVDEFTLHCAGLIAHEAGCLISNLKGEAKLKSVDDIVIASPKLMKPLLNTLKG